MCFALLERFAHRTACSIQTRGESLIEFGSEPSKCVFHVLPSRPAKIFYVADHNSVDFVEKTASNCFLCASAQVKIDRTRPVGSASVRPRAPRLPRMACACLRTLRR